MTEQTIPVSLDVERQQLLAEMRYRVERESDRLAGEARELAERLAAIERRDLDMAQVRNVENLAYSTGKVSDLTDLLKKLIGRDTQGKRWAREAVGYALVNTLEGLSEPAERIAGRLRRYQQAYQTYDNDLPRQVHLQLCREFIRHMVAHFEFARLQNDPNFWGDWAGEPQR